MTVAPAVDAAKEVMGRPDFLPPPVVPRDEIETALVAMWERLLEIAPIGIDDDFFQLDGDSFLAVTLFEEIDEKWARDLSPSSLIGAPTIRVLAERIANPEPRLEHPSIVVFNDTGSRPPLYLMHGRGGEVIFARPVADALDAEQPMYALRYAFGHETWPRPVTVVGLAAAYVEMLRERHGAGPYRLAGFSLGAALALEMAQQIRASGGVIDCLIMIDPPVAPGKRGQRLSRHARDFFRHRPGKAIKLLANRLWIALIRQLRDLTVWLPEIGRDKSLPVLNREQRRQMNELTTAFKAYRPKRYEGPVTIISCADSRRVHGDSMLGWAHLFTGPITTLEMPGTHHSMIREPYIHELAAHMVDCLGE